MATKKVQTINVNMEVECTTDDLLNDLYGSLTSEEASDFAIRILEDLEDSYDQTKIEKLINKLVHLLVQD